MLDIGKVSSKNTTRLSCYPGTCAKAGISSRVQLCIHSIATFIAIHVYIVQMWSYNNTFLIMISYSSSDIVILIHFRHVTPTYAAWYSPLRFFSSFFAPFILLLGRLFFWSAVSRGLLFSHPFIGCLDPTNWPSGE